MTVAGAACGFASVCDTPLLMVKSSASVREALREPLRIVDIHPHVISTDETHYPRVPIGGHQSDWSRERPVPYEKMITAMDAAGIAKSALVQASTCYGHDNSYVADAAAAHPERFTGVFSCDVLAKWNGVSLIRLIRYVGAELLIV